MTTAEREQTDAGRTLVENLKDIYERMNLMQQATGKFQLQVGQYGKAVSGLNIATTQVLRELPALAVSPTTFAIAISNNIPILQDYIIKVRESRTALMEQIAAAEAAGEAEKAAALKAEAAKYKNLSVTKLLVKSIFSWQSALVLVLTVLPIVLRNLAKKRKEQSEYNDILKETIDLTEELSKADLKANQEGAKAATKAKTLYNITQDQNRSYEERLAVAKEMQRLYPEYLGNIDAEAIVAGKATSAYDSLTEALIRKAKAQAYLSRITEIETKKILAEEAHTRKIEEYEKTPKYAYVSQGTAGGYAVVSDATKDIEKENERYKKQMEEFNKLQQELDFSKNRKRIRTSEECVEVCWLI